jgi:hypothetical protein
MSYGGVATTGPTRLARPLILTGRDKASEYVASATASRAKRRPHTTTVRRAASRQPRPQQDYASAYFAPSTGPKANRQPTTGNRQPATTSRTRSGTLGHAKSGARTACCRRATVPPGSSTRS